VNVGRQGDNEIQKAEMEQRTEKGENRGKRKTRSKGVERQSKGEIKNNKGEKRNNKRDEKAIKT
jgi:hypothetical protein